MPDSSKITMFNDLFGDIIGTSANSLQPTAPTANTLDSAADKAASDLNSAADSVASSLNAHALNIKTSPSITPDVVSNTSNEVYDVNASSAGYTPEGVQELLQKYPNVTTQGELLEALQKDNNKVAIESIFGSEALAEQEAINPTFNAETININQARQVNSQNRSALEIAGDTGASLLQWATEMGRVGTLINSTGKMDEAQVLEGIEAIRNNPDIDDATKQNVINQLRESQLKPGFFETGGTVDKKLHEWTQDLDKAKSDTMQAANTVVEADFQERRKALVANSERLRSNGNTPEALIKATEGLGDFALYTQTLLEHPDAAFDIVAKSIPDLVTGSGLARLSMKSAIHGAEAKLSRELGRSATEKEVKDYIASDVGKEYMKKVGINTTLAYVAVTEGGTNATQTYDKIMDMKPEELANKSAAYNSLIEKGFTPEESKHLLATNAAFQTAAIQGPLAALASKFTGAAHFEAGLFSPDKLFSKASNVSGSIFGSVGKGVGEIGARTANTLKEGVENALQGATGQFAQNVGVKNTANDNQNLTEDIGKQAGAGLIGGLGMGATVQSHHAAKLAGVYSYKGLVKGTQLASIPIKKVGSWAYDKLTAKERANVEAEQQQAAKDMQSAFQGEVDATVTEAPVNDSNAANSDNIETQGQSQETVTTAQGETAVPTITPEVVKRGKQEPVLSEQDLIIPEQYLQTDEAKRLVTEGTTQGSTNRTKDIGTVMLNTFKAMQNPKLAPEVRTDLAEYAFSLGATMYSRSTSLKEQLVNMDSTSQEYADTARKIVNIDRIIANPVFSEVFANSAALLTPDAGAVEKAIERANSQIEMNKESYPEIKPLLWQVRQDATKVPEETLNTLIDNAENLGLNPAELSSVQSAAIQAKTLREVSSDVRNGTDNFKGINTYFQDINDAFARGDTARIGEEMTRLQSFADYMSAKASTFSDALAQTAPGKSITPIHPMTGTPWLTANGQPYKIHQKSTKLVQNISKDAMAVSKAVEEMRNILKPQEPIAAENKTVSEPAAPVETAPVQEAVQETVTEPETTNEVVAEDTAQPKNSLVDRVVTEGALGANSAKGNAATQESAKTNMVKKHFSPIRNEMPIHKDPAIVDKLLDESKVAEALGKEVSPEQAHLVTVAMREFIRDDFMKTFRDTETTYDDPSKIYFGRDRMNYFVEPQTVDGKTVYRVSDQVVDAIGINAMTWVGAMADRLTMGNTPANIKQILGMDSQATLTEAQWEKLQNIGIPKAGLANMLGSEILRTLGLRADNNIPLNIEDGIKDSLGMAALNTLENIGVIETNSILEKELHEITGEDVAPGKKVQFVRMPTGKRDTNPTYTSGDILTALAQRVTPIITGSLVSEPPRRVATLNEPINYKVKRDGKTVYEDLITNGGGQRAPQELAKARAIEANKPFKINLGMHELALNQLGTEWVRDMLGYTRDMEYLSIPEQATADGKNRTIDLMLQTYENGMQRLEDAGIPFDEAELRMHYNIGVNNRLNMASADFNPQLHKLHRELLGREPVELSMDNPTHMSNLRAAVAQSIGISIDKQSYNTTMKDLGNALAKPEFRNGIEAIKELITNQGEEATDAQRQAIAEAVKAGGENTKSLHGLYTHAMFELATLRGDKTFSTPLTLEIDGVTHGPFSAYFQLGLDQLNQNTLDMLKKGGFYFGEIGRLYNETVEADPTFRDLYQTPGEFVQKSLTEAVNKMVATEGTNSPLIRKLRIAAHFIGGKKLKATFDNTTSSIDIEVMRNLTKNPVTVSGAYGGSADANNRNLAKDTMAGFASLISEYLKLRSQTTNAAEIAALDAQMVRDAALFSEVTNPTITKTIRGKKVQTVVGTPIRIKSYEDAKNFRFNDAHAEGVTAAVAETVGKAIETGINSTLGSVQRRGEQLVTASNIMNMVFMDKYKEAIDRKLKELRDSGELGQYDFLNQKQMDEVRAETLQYAPITGTPFINGETLDNNLGNGILVSRTDSTETNIRTRSSVGVRGADGKVRQTEANFSYNSYGSAGVRALALTVQALEGYMQAYNTLNNKEAPTQDVFDGLESTLARLASSSQHINTGFVNAMKFDLMKDFNDRFNKFVDAMGIENVADTINTLAEQAAEAKDKGLLNDLKLLKLNLGLESDTGGSIEGVKVTPYILHNFIKTFDNETRIQTVMKRALLSDNTPFTSDQMTGANYSNSWNANKSLDGKTPLEAWKANISEQLGKPVDAERQAKAEEPQTEVNTNLGSTTSAFGTQVMGREGVVSALRTRLRQEKNQAGELVLDIISKSLPDGLQVHFGTPEAIGQAVQSLFPNQFDTNQFDAKGVTVGDTIFVANKGTETVLHELTHAATQDVINQFYTNPKELSPSIRKQVSALEKLMRDFAFSNTIERSGDTAFMTNLIRDHLANKDTYSATSEFVAWSLTNPQVREVAATKGTRGAVSQFIKNVFDTVAKMFGITGVKANSYFMRVLQRVNTISDYQSTRTGTNNESTPLYQRPIDDVNRQTVREVFGKLDKGNMSTEHVNKLIDMVDKVYTQLRMHVTREHPLSGPMKYDDALLINAIESPEIMAQANTLMAHGFPMTTFERQIYKAIHAAVETGLETKQFQRIELQRLYESAKRQLSVDDFLMGGTREQAAQRYDAIFGNAIQTRADGTTNRLANFLALAYTNEGFAKSLEKVKANDTKTSAEFDINTFVGSNMSRLFGYLSKAGTSNNINSRLQKLANQLTVLDAQTKDNLVNNFYRNTQDLIETAEQMALPQRTKAAEWLDKTLGKVPGGLAAQIPLNAAISDVNLESYTNGMLASLNTGLNVKNGFVRELITEIMGTNDTNRSVHDLLNQAKAAVEQVRQRTVEVTPGHLRSKFSKPLTKEDSTAIQKVLTDLDISTMVDHGYSLADIQNFISNKANRAAEIAAKEQAIRNLNMPTPLTNFVLNQAEGLGHLMATGKASIGFQLPNAHAIQQLSPNLTNSQVNGAVMSQIAPLVDDLASLYGMNYTDQTHLDKVSDLLDTEQEGINTTLRLASVLRKAEQAKAYGDVAMQVQKGSSYAINDPNMRAIIAPITEAKSLESQGFTRGNAVPADMADTTGNKLFYFYSDTAAQSSWVSGVMSTLRQTIGGVNVSAGFTHNGTSVQAYMQKDTVRDITKAKDSLLQSLVNGRVSGQATGNNMLPILNADGSIRGYTYTISKADRDARLNTNNDFADILGSWQGRVLEEQLAPAINNQLVDTLANQLKQDSLYGRIGQHIDITPDSKDPQIREIYRMMPPEMKQYVKDKFPGGVLKVRKDLLNNAMGFRQYSLTEVFSKDPKTLSEFEKAFKTIAGNILGQNAARLLAKGEKGWKELVGLGKDIVVVKNVFVQAANMISNMVQLWLNGVGFIQQAKDFTVAVEAAESYHRNARELIRLDVDKATTSDAAKISRIDARMSEIRDKQARNPASQLIEEGLLPTISTDLTANSQYTYGGKLMEKLDGALSHLPKFASESVKNFLMTKDSSVYGFLNKTNQYSDFVSKYSLYKHLTTRKVNPLTKEQAMNHIKDEFVNYNLLPSRTRNYLEATGITWFLNYKLRSQKTMLRLIRENPARALMLLGSGGMGLPTIYDANLLTGSLTYNIGPENITRMYASHPLVSMIGGATSFVSGQVFR